MTTTSTTTSSSRRIRAVLAGGLVLGAGAAITLAAWNDSEFASGTFTAGTFNMQGAADGTTFSDHTSAPGASLAFTANVSNLSPSAVTAAGYALHLSPTTSTSATVAVAGATTTGAATANLTYGIVQVAQFSDCVPGATGTATIVPAGTTMNAVTGASTFQLAKSTDGVAAGANVYLCVQVTAGSGIGQGTAATGTWEFRATSNAS